ncbi:dihydropyrimidinase like protein, partial [Danaus plexippus plexippus]
VHAENGGIIARNSEKLLEAGVKGPEGHAASRDDQVEAEAVNRACVIANQMDAPLYIVHMMSAAAVQSLRNARRVAKHPIFGETLAATVGTDGQAMLVSLVYNPPGSHYKNACFRHAAAHVLSPPLRDPSTPEAIIDALAHDDLQVIASDNCTFNEKDKELGKNDFTKIPNGVNGVEDRMAILWQKAVNTGVMDPCRFVAVTSTNAANIFNLPSKGRVAVGADGDVIVWDPRLEKTISAATHHHAVDFNIFEGQRVVGGPQYVIVNGRVCLDDGDLRVAEGYGKFLPTPPNSPYVYGEVPTTPQPERVEYLPSPARVTNGTPTELQISHKLEATSVSGCSTPTGRKMREPGQRNLQNSTFSISQLQISHKLEATSVSGCSTPTGRKMREPGQRNLQNSTFSISQEMEGLDTKTSVRVRNPPGGKSSGLW